MNYRSVKDLNDCIVANLSRLPRDIELVVGIPRSGLLAANLIALHRNLPLADLDGYLAGRVLSGGERLRKRIGATTPWKEVKTLVVDDSVYYGKAMDKARERIRGAGLGSQVVYACVFVNPGSICKVDIFLEVCPIPRVFEWNIMHHSCLESSCVDVDGVLCRDPSEEENDDGPLYERFLTEVEPVVVPSYSIGWLVTCRLEKYRAQTTAWLARHNIHYRELIMMNYPNKAARLAAGNHAAFKATAYARTGAVLFVESSLAQAVEIAERTGRHVFSMETREMMGPGFLPASKRLAREMAMRNASRVKRLAARMWRLCLRWSRDRPAQVRGGT